MTTRPNKYADLDAAITHTIQSGNTDFTSIWMRNRKAAEALSTSDRWGRKNASRVIDRRLQALRKAGRIRYAKGKWEVIA